MNFFSSPNYQNKITSHLSPTRLKRVAALVLCALTLVAWASPARSGSFDIQFNVNETGFNASQLTVLYDSLDYAEAMWEGAITGYQPNITINQVIINVRRINSGLASAGVSGTSIQSGFWLPTSGFLNINPAAIDIYASWDGSGPDPNTVDPNFIGLNYVDDIVAHEVGHNLGVGTLWQQNGVRSFNAQTMMYEYTGQYGVAAFQQEFDSNATFVPIESAGSTGTMGSHWDQLMRSSSQEGDPGDPWSLDPRQGIVDKHGRDFSLELMTGALDPDYGEPFFSNTTIQSMRDLGYTVIPEPSTFALILVAGALGCSLKHRRERRPHFPAKNLDSFG